MLGLGASGQPKNAPPYQRKKESNDLLKNAPPYQRKKRVKKRKGAKKRKGKRRIKTKKKKSAKNPGRRLSTSAPSLSACPRTRTTTVCTLAKAY